MAACGLWRSRRRLVAVVVDDDGRPAPAILAAREDSEVWSLLESVDAAHGLDTSLVVPEALLKTDSIGQLALARGHELWIAPQPLVDAIRAATGLVAAPRLAAMVARLALVPGFRGHLRRIDRAACDWRQLRLL
jgi:hypothetical protein